MRNMKKRSRNLGGLLCLLAAATLFACEKVPDYCGKGVWFDPSCQFCFAGKAYNQCGGNNYNPLTQGCINGAEIGTRCADGTAVPLGTPCGGYTLTTAAIPENGGGITRTPDKQRYAAGEQIAASAAPAENFAFVGWAGALNSAAPAVTLLMNANKPLAAMFRPLNAPGTLITTAFPPNGGAIERSPNKTVYNLGETVTVTATANHGYTFAGWAGAAASKNASETILMDDSKTLVAMFTPVAHTLTVNVNPTDAGAVFVNGTALSGNVSQDFGTQISVRAIAEKGYAFKEWTGTAEFADRHSANTWITPGTDAAITAIFQPGGGEAGAPDDSGKTPLYPVTVVIGATGAAVVGGSYAEGATVTIKAGAAPTGQRFKNWTTESGGVTFANANSATTTFVMPGGAVVVTAGFVNSDIQYGTLNDSRDGKTYKTVEIGGQTWMAENINFVTEDSWCYGEGGQVFDVSDYKTLTPAEIQANCNTYGRLYTWNAAMTACPAGWKLPNGQDWEMLVTIAGGLEIAGKRLKSMSGWNWNTYDDVSGNGTDDYGFSALPGGYYGGGGLFGNVGDYGYWWTARQYTSNDAYYRVMGYNNGPVNENRSDKSGGYSVRCVAD